MPVYRNLTRVANSTALFYHVTHLPAPQRSRLVVDEFDDGQVGQGSPDQDCGDAQLRPLG